jgi:hypothetical protein
VAETSQVTPFDYTALTTNIGILVAFIAAVFAGIRKGLKELKTSDKVRPADLAAATILENVTLNEWSSTNREVVEVIGDLIRATEELRSAVYHHRDDLRDHGRELAELRHHVERLRDRLA